MGLLIRILFGAALLLALVYLVARSLGVNFDRQPFSRHKCRDCAHCRGIVSDGVICGFGNREVFKNEVHIANCVDHRRRAARGA